MWAHFFASHETWQNIITLKIKGIQYYKKVVW